MLRNGVAINESLKVLASNASSGRVKRLATELRKSVEGGRSFSACLAEHPQVFDQTYIGVAQAGEGSATLGESMNYMADWLEHRHDLRSNIQRALLYPSIILGAVGMLLILIITFLLPRIIPIFASFKTELPLPTKMLVALAGFMSEHGLIVALCVVAVCILVILVRRIQVVRRMLDHTLLHIPIIGALNHEYQLAVYCKSFGMLYEKGVRVNEASLTAAKTITNSYMRSVAMRVASQTEHGKDLASLLGEYPTVFPAHMRAITGVSERSGSLARSLNEIADHYAKRVSYKSERLPTLLEPLLLTAIGILIGFIAISIILPIYQLSSSLQ